MPMTDYIFLMHDDITPNRRSQVGADWPGYLDRLQEAGVFEGGSAIGDGVCVSKNAFAAATSHHLAGYIRIHAEDLSHARRLVIGNPVYEAGGTVEIRELPKE